jgi:spermidine synthase
MFALVACFTLSGCAGLIYQTAWLREFTIIYGSDVYATGALLAAFLGGLGGGGALASRYLQSRRFVSFRAYAVLELVIAATAYLTHRMVPINEWLMVELIGFIPMGYVALLVKVLVVLVFILPPTLAMGATFPIFVRAWAVSMDRAGSRLATAYSLNTLGAVGGTLAAAFVLIPSVGLRWTIGTAALINLFAALLALAVTFGSQRRANEQEVPETKETTGDRTGVWPVFVYFLMGVAAIGAEVLWTRVLLHHIGTSVYAFAVMLAVVLTGIGTGSLLVAHWADRLGPRAWFACLSGLGVALVAHLFAIRELPQLVFAFREFAQPNTFTGHLLMTTLTGVVPLVVPTLLMGVSFPLGIRILSETPQGLARRTGQLYAANSAGAVVGAVLTSTALLGHLGVNGSAALFAGLYLVAAGFVAARLLSPPLRVWALVGVAALSPALLLLLPREPVLAHVGEHRTTDDKLIVFLEGTTTTVSVRQLANGHNVLEINLINVAGTTPQLISTQKLQAHLPLMMHPDPRSVLHIGFGSGGTAYAVSRHPVEKIDIVEITPDVVGMADRHFSHINRGVVDDPRVHFLWGDGRNYLLTATERYDVILSDSIHPAHSAGNGNLYTVEYFRHAASRLEPDGIFSVWLPMYGLTPDNFQQILKALSDAFAHVSVWYAHDTINRWVLVTGSRSPDFALPGSSIMDARFEIPQVREDLAEIGYTHALDLLDNLILGDRAIRRALAGVEPHHDDMPRAEYESSRKGAVRQNWLDSFDWLLQHRESFGDYLADPGEWSAERVMGHGLASASVVRAHRAYVNCEGETALELSAEALEQLPGYDKALTFMKKRRGPKGGRTRPEWCVSDRPRSNPRPR